MPFRRPDKQPDRSTRVPFWRTVTYVSAVECESCQWHDDSAKGDKAAREAGRRHVLKNPGHRVRVETGRTTIYGEPRPT